MKKSELFFTAILIPLDAVAIALAFMSAYFLRSSGNTFLFAWPLSQYIKLTIFSLPLWIAIFATHGLYSVKPSRRTLDEIPSLLLATISSWALFAVILYFIRDVENFDTFRLSRKILLYIPLFSFTYLLLIRYVLHTVQRYLYRFNIGSRRVLMVGNDNGMTRSIARSIQTNPSLGYRLIQHIASNQINSLTDIFNKTSFDDLILTDPALPDSEILFLQRFCDENNLVFRQVPNLMEVKSPQISFVTIDGTPMIEFHATPLEGWSRILKRLFDIVSSLIALIIFTIPMAIVALLIKLDSKGPVFYLHERIGQHGNPFFLYKFRTMKLEYCRGSSFGGAKAETYFQNLMNQPEFKKEFDKDYKLKNDPRVTRIGKLLRKLSLDELPQLINVLEGKLSLVGPRPIVKDEMSKYGELRYKRHIIKPGITGLWQVSGRNDIPYEERIRLDLYYLENWSLWFDVAILFKTCLSLIRKNTY